MRNLLNRNSVYIKNKYGFHGHGPGTATEMMHLKILVSQFDIKARMCCSYNLLTSTTQVRRRGRTQIHQRKRRDNVWIRMFIKEEAVFTSRLFVLYLFYIFWNEILWVTFHWAIDVGDLRAPRFQTRKYKIPASVPRIINAELIKDSQRTCILARPNGQSAGNRRAIKMRKKWRTMTW